MSSQPVTAWHGTPIARTGIVVAVRVEPVADEQHVFQRDPGLLGELPHAVGLVDPAVGDVDGRRAARAHLEVADLRCDSLAQSILLCAGRIPRGLRLQRGTLAERGESDLRAPVFEDVAPRLGFPQPQSARLALDRAHGAALLIVGERVGVDGHDVAVFDAVVLRAARGKQMDVREDVG